MSKISKRNTRRRAPAMRQDAGENKTGIGKRVGRGGRPRRVLTTEERRDLVDLLDLGLPFERVAKFMGIPRNSLKSLISRDDELSAILAAARAKQQREVLREFGKTAMKALADPSCRNHMSWVRWLGRVAGLPEDLLPETDRGRPSPKTDEATEVINVITFLKRFPMDDADLAPHRSNSRDSG